MPKSSLSFAEKLITSPLLRWTWSGHVEPQYLLPIAELRPCDKEAATDMMAGRYLLAAKLVDSKTHSPFSIDEVDENWKQRLNDFSWLRHFSESQDVREREFATVLVLDWIGRNTKFNHNSWSPLITSLRTLNWLRHLALLKEGASEKQIKIITRSLGTQIQSLKLRFNFMSDQIDVIYSAMAILASALAKNSNAKSISSRLTKLQILLDEQIDVDGLHVSRNSFLQFKLLSELVSLKQSLGQVNNIPSLQKENFAKTLKSMHFALDSLTLGTGELAYFNGTKQLPADLFVALQANGQRKEKQSQILSGYGILVCGKSILIADSGVVPDIKFAKSAHASALAFEFSNGNDLLLGNCGPAISYEIMSNLYTERDNYFRLGNAHNGPTIDNISSAKIQKLGVYANHLKKTNISNTQKITLKKDDVTMSLRSDDFVKRFGVELSREFSMIDNGETLVGVDRIIPCTKNKTGGMLELVFQLAPNAILTKGESDNIFYFTLKSGAKWIFLWEGAQAYIDKSVRHSDHFGPLPVTKIVLKSNIDENKEISWVFTSQVQ